MKIFYAVQATGNGHISRAMELLPYLKKYGTVDIFLSGDNSNLQLDAPIAYRSKGMSLQYTCDGSLSYFNTIRSVEPFRLQKEIRELPVEKYDLIINDFDYITAAACKRKKISSINFGHQASFQSSKTPRPAKKNAAGEWILKRYAEATHYVGLHFERYDDFIFTPVVKKQILETEPADKNYITVYLPSYCEAQLIDIFTPFKDFRFEIFSRESSQPWEKENITFIPVNKTRFNESLINCTGIITGGGFETPAEAIHLGKKIISIPIRGQYEQICNAAALQQMGITTLKTIDESFTQEFYNWVMCKKTIAADYSQSIPKALEYVFNIYESSTEKDMAIALSEAEPWKI
ncbi:MAG: glycosyl transferase [Bacteroidetes bacterium]|nr:glycosyl transferase [Bacteroidota bacterium]